MNDKNHLCRRAGTIALAALTLGAAPFLSACGSSSGASGASFAGKSASGPASHHVKVDLNEFNIRPSTPKGAPGRVVFNVTNTGQETHELVVIRTSKSASGLEKGSRASESGSLGEIGDLKPGQSKTLALRLHKGHYALICNLPGHYMSGMRRDFTVA